MNAINTITTLNWQDRPAKVKEKITDCFQALACRNELYWGYKGASHYNMCGINEHQWLTAFIQQHNFRNDFYVLDVGAGDFSFGRAVANTINQHITDGKLRENISVTIISLCGEQNPDQEEIQDGNCRLLNLGAFKIENLFEELQIRNLDVENKVDLIVSRWTFCHLIDPVGTFAQALSLLRPVTGLLCMDEFYFLYNDQPYDDQNIIQLLFDANIPFIMKEKNYLEMNEMHQFALKRKNADCFPLQLEYNSLKLINRSGEYRDVLEFKSHYLENFQMNPSQLYKSSCEITGLYGDQTLFEELKPYIHEGPLENNPFLKNSDCDLYCLDTDRYSQLCVSIELNQKEMFDRILQTDPLSVTFVDSDGNTPLHIAVKYDTLGYFIEKLIAAGVDTQHPNHMGLTPSYLAFINGNTKAEEHLKNTT